MRRSSLEAKIVFRRNDTLRTYTSLDFPPPSCQRRIYTFRNAISHAAIITMRLSFAARSVRCLVTKQTLSSGQTDSTSRQPYLICECGFDARIGRSSLRGGVENQRNNESVKAQDFAENQNEHHADEDSGLLHVRSNAAVANYADAVPSSQTSHAD
jgi:hypothetical protein